MNGIAFITESFKGKGHEFCKICWTDFSFEQGVEKKLRDYANSVINMK